MHFGNLSYKPLKPPATPAQRCFASVSEFSLMILIIEVEVKRFISLVNFPTEWLVVFYVTTHVLLVRCRVASNNSTWNSCVLKSRKTKNVSKSLLLKLSQALEYKFVLINRAHKNYFCTLYRLTSAKMGVRFWSSFKVRCFCSFAHYFCIELVQVAESSLLVSIFICVK